MTGRICPEDGNACRLSICKQDCREKVEREESAVSAAAANVETQRGVISTEHRITGSLQAVLGEIERIFTNKHPLGYGTYVSSISMPSDGVYVARVSHANSCE